MARIMRADIILTLLYLPPLEHQGRADRLLFERREGYSDDTDAWSQLAWFVTETARALELLASILPEAEALDDTETPACPHRPSDATI